MAIRLDAQLIATSTLAFLLRKEMVKFFCIVSMDAQQKKFAVPWAFKLESYSSQTNEELLMVNVIQYHYHDEQGKLLFTKVRLEPSPDGRSKSFYFERMDENGNLVKNLNGCRKTLYRLQILLYGISENNTIFLVEGEKDVDNLIDKGFIATTTSTSLEWDDEFTATLQDADVVILYDMDKTGLKRRDLLLEKLFGRVKRLRVVDLPGLEYSESHGADISDWLDKGNAVEQLQMLVDQTPDYMPHKDIDDTLIKTDKIRSIALGEFLSLKIPPREIILSPFLTKQGLVMLYAKRGVGKTHVALGIAYAVASGGSFLKWHAPVARNVLYIDGEMPAVALQERLRKISSQAEKSAESTALILITPDLQNDIIPDLSTKEGQDAIEEFIKDRDLIIIDNISSLFRSSAENEAESWQPVQEWALGLRRRGKSVLFVHHAGKSGQQRGTSKREDQLDAVIILKQPDDYQPQDGACFEVHFEKTRHFYGEDAAAFKVTLTDEGIDNNLNWEVSQVDIDEEVTEIADLMNKGLTIGEMVQKTKLTKSQVETRMKKARKNGLTQR